MVNLHDLAGKGNLEGVQKFLKSHAAKVDKTNQERQTALHCSAKGGHVEVCRELISSVASVDAKDSKQRTPLRVAVDSNKPLVVKFLCESGASTSLADPVDQRTPLHWAANKGFTECACILLEHGAVIDGNPDKWGHLPEEDCPVSEIRIMIENARKGRAADNCCKYNTQVATAPPMPRYNEGEGSAGHHQGFYGDNSGGGGAAAYSSSDLPPFYQESVMFSQYAAPERGGSTDRKPLSPSTLARMAANLGGDLCAGCNAPERARQLTPCHHVVCRDCARRSRDEEEDGCPVCHSQVFDDNSLLT